MVAALDARLVTIPEPVDAAISSVVMSVTLEAFSWPPLKVN